MDLKEAAGFYSKRAWWWACSSLAFASVLAGALFQRSLIVTMVSVTVLLASLLQFGAWLVLALRQQWRLFSRTMVAVKVLGIPEATALRKVPPKVEEPDAGKRPGHGRDE